MNINTVKPADYESIACLLDLAFHPSTYESRLMSDLRKSHRRIHEWTLRVENQIVAHIAYSIAYRENSIPCGFHLAPVSVHPEHQRRGLGTFLIRETLALPHIVESPVFVLGDPAYYRRFGFAPTQAPKCPFDENNQHFQCLRWNQTHDFIIGYEPEFHQV